MTEVRKELTIIKRSGKEVFYNDGKIKRAIERVYEDLKLDINHEIIDNIEDNIYTEIQDGDISYTVEMIQDMVEDYLIEYNEKSVAKKYILYRAEHNTDRKNPSKYKILSKDFLSKYKHSNEPFPTIMSHFTYLRTYSRYLPDENRRERWWETVARVVEYNCSLAPTTREEAEEIYDNIYNLRQFTSGRSLWVANTEVSKKYPMSNYNCFDKNTEFLTNKGIFKFKDFKHGDKVKVLNKNGAWAEATVKNFGVDQLYDLVLTYGKRKKIIRTTKDHLWFIRKTPNEKKYIEKSTIDLKDGDIVREKRRYEHHKINPCPIGIQHGIVFGDGTYDRRKNYCKISLIEKKQELLKYFNTGVTSTEGDRDSTLVYALPNTWKQLPPLNSNVEYLYGFILGLISADGSVNASVSIANKDYQVLEYIKSMGEIVGLTSNSISFSQRKNNNFNSDSEGVYKLSFHKKLIDKEMLLRELHKTKFQNNRDLNWRVVSVTPTDTFTDVWCVEEPETNTFTLADGILTHNCAFKIVDTFDTFHEGFYLLLIGAGMGFRVLPEDVEKLPKIRTDISIKHKYYSQIFKNKRKEHTELSFDKNVSIITIGDSKEGWVRGLQLFLEIQYNPIYRDIDTIELIYDNIRPKGERLKTFGGYASGHESMQIMLSKIENIIKNSSNKFNNHTKLSSIDCTDMANIIGENVVSGGVRRTAEIVLFDKNDDLMINAKTNLYQLENGKWNVNQDIIHRQMSNNSIFYDEKPDREKLHWQIEAMRYSGEPAFINREAGNKRRPNYNGNNACAEILLDSSGMCNLTEIVPLRFVENGILNEEKLYKAQRLSARIGYRMTLVDFELPSWDFINKRDRLIGCSVTGWQDFVNLLNLDKSEQIRILNKLRDVAIDESKKISNELGLNEPVLKLTCKPSGTISLLPAVSSGVHFSHDEFYIRRIRINAHDPLAEAMKDMKFNWKPEVGQSEENATTIVFEFPMKAPKGRTKYDVSAIEQLEIYKMFMEEYADHNVSITVHVRNHEWDDVEEWVWNNWDSIVAVSFLSLDDSFFELLPYESIEESVYNEMMSSLPKFKPEILQKFEKGEDLEIDSSSCENGVCPIR